MWTEPNAHGRLLFLVVRLLAVSSVSLAQAPTEAKERYLDVLRLKGAGAYVEALEAAKRLGSEAPELEPVHRTIVDLFLLLDDADGARRFFQDRLDEISYYGVGRIDFHEGNLDGAIENFHRAAETGSALAEVFGLHRGLPRIYEAKRDHEAGIAYFAALTTSSPRDANAWAGLGWSYARSFRFDEAMTAFHRAIELDPNHVQTQHGLVQSYSRMGQYRKSLEACDVLEHVADRAADFEMVAYAHMMRGTVLYRQGDYRSALDQLREAQTLAHEIGDTAREGAIINNTAVVYATAGDYEKALPYFETSVELEGEAVASSDTISNIGNVHKRAGRYERAIEYYREAGALQREADLRRELASSIVNMAEAYHLLGDLETGERLYLEGLAIAEETSNTIIEAYAAGLLGRLNRDRGNFDEAIAFFERQLEIGESTGELQATWEARAGLGSMYRRRGDTAEAIEHYAEAIALYDSIRESLAIESMGSAFLEDKYEAYPSIIQLLASQDRLEEAFDYAEKYKAKGFLDILARGHTLFESQLPDSLRFELDEIRDLLQRAYAAPASSAAEQVARQERITELELRRASIVERVRDEHGDFYQLALSEPLAAATIQSDVLAPGQYLAQYVVGDEALSIFVVSRDALLYREVDVSREELRRQLSELSAMFAADSDRMNVVNPALADFSIPPAAALYETLMAPIEDWLVDGAELVIVPDDFLFYLPFETLVVDARVAEHRYDFANARFVVEEYSVSYSTSASLLDPALRRPRAFDKGVLAFGNPAFGNNAADQPPLPNAEAEVEAISDAFGGYDNGVYTGGAAREDVFAQRASDYGVLHFATHFLADDTQPLYSRIMLAANDELQTYEIFDTELNAELAVLSACNTGLGKLEKGEGLIGINRAFLYAGVPSLVVSLWSVDDKATARVMVLFYEYLRSGASKKQALRQAKLDYLSESDGELKDPFYWAPFVLNGDWSPLSLPEPRRLPWVQPAAVALVLVLLLIMVALFIWKRRRSPA